MSITWIPIDQCPEEWKDGREVLGMRRYNPSPFFMKWNRMANFFREKWLTGCDASPTHVAEIPPELRPENIGLGKRVSVMLGTINFGGGDVRDYWTLILNDNHVGGITRFPEGDYVVKSQHYPTLQAAIDAFEETLL